MNKNIKFAEWLAENHYSLWNVEKGIYYWRNEYNKKTTNQLFEDFEKENER